MAIKKIYAAGQGPYIYDDTNDVNDRDGDFSGKTHQAVLTDGTVEAANMICTNAPTDPTDVVRLQELLEPASMVDGDVLEITWEPENYSPVVVSGVTTSGIQLTSHLAGLDAMYSGVIASGTFQTMDGQDLTLRAGLILSSEPSVDVDCVLSGYYDLTAPDGIDLTSDSDIDLASEQDMRLTGDVVILRGLDSGSYIKIRPDGSDTTAFWMFYIDSTFGQAFYPYTNGKNCLGSSTREFYAVYAARHYDSNTLIYDDFDDLKLLRDVISPKKNEKDEVVRDKKTGLMQYDLATMPEWLTNKGELRAILKGQNGDLISETDFEEMVQDPEDLGWALKRNMGAFGDLTNGALRQIDKELTGIVEDLIGMIQQLQTRVTLLEAKIGE